MLGATQKEHESEPGWDGGGASLGCLSSAIRSGDKCPRVRAGLGLKSKGQTKSLAAEPEAGARGRAGGMAEGLQPRRWTSGVCRKEFHQVWPSTPVQAQEDRGWDRWGGHGRSLRYKHKRRVSRVGVGLTVGWGEPMWEAEPSLRTRGWQEGPAQPTLPTGFLGGDTQARSLPQGILVVAGTAPAPALPTADTAHSRDAAAAVGHVATADRAGPEAIATAAASAADDGCRGRAGQHPSGRARDPSWSNGLGGVSSHSCPYPQVKISLE